MKNSLIQLTLLMASVAANPTPDTSFSMEVRGPGDDASGLHARSELSKRNGWLYCGVMANGYEGDLRALYNDFGGETYTAPANGCIRAKCWNTSGIYVCNDKNTPLTVSGTEIKKHVINIFNNCCLQYSDLSYDWGYYMNGQQFTDALGGFNVLAGYADCKENQYVKPTNEGGGGVNGKACLRNSMYIG